MHSYRSSQENGFSLIEVLIVVAILGVMSAIAIPTLGDFMRDYKLNQFSTSLRTAVRSMRFQAIKNQRRVHAEFELGSGPTVGEDRVRFLICTAPSAPDTGECDAGFEQFDDMATITPPDPIVIYSVCGQNSVSTQEVGFKADGSASGPAGCSQPYIQITWAPTPPESEECKFNTIRMDSNTGVINFWKFLRNPNENVNDISC